MQKNSKKTIMTLCCFLSIIAFFCIFGFFQTKNSESIMLDIKSKTISFSVGQPKESVVESLFSNNLEFELTDKYMNIEGNGWEFIVVQSNSSEFSFMLRNDELKRIVVKDFNGYDLVLPKNSD